MPRTRLAQPERIYLANDAVKSHYSLLAANAPFIGSIISDRVQATGCLLRDGSVLTCLHAICDLDRVAETGSLAACYDDLSATTIYFVRGGYIYSYAIAGIIHDGSDVLNQCGAAAATYDYARLQLTGNPLADLGGGLALDQTNYFGSAMNIEPTRTLAISGPRFSRNQSGGWCSARQASVSGNQAATSRYYMFSQTGSHATQEGFSGQAIFPLTGLGPSTLYAIHAGVNRMSGSRFGIKVADYQMTVRAFAPANTPVVAAYNAVTPHPSLQYVSHQSAIAREGLRRRGQDARDILTFLRRLAQFIRGTSDSVALPPALQPRHHSFADSHQYQHTGGRANKSYFYGAVANSPRNPVFDVLLNSVNKIVSEYYQEHRKSCNKKTTNFIVDLGFNIGVDKETNQETSCVQIDGFSGATYHIYPRDISAGLPKNSVCIDAQEYLNRHLPRDECRVRPQRTYVRY